MYIAFIPEVKSSDLAVEAKIDAGRIDESVWSKKQNKLSIAAQMITDKRVIFKDYFIVEGKDHTIAKIVA